MLGFSPQAYYAWLAAPISPRDLEDAYLLNALIDARSDDPEFGYRFLADELQRAGLSVGERRVRRLCSQQKSWSTTVRKGRRGSGRMPGPAVHDDHLQRDFTAAGANQVWVTDTTEHPTAEGEVYCCAIKDLFSNRIVSYALDERVTAQLAVTALRTAVARRRPKGVVVVYSDRGSKFRARTFRVVLAATGLQGSMGRVASAGDNAAMESFWALLQKNVLDRRRWRTRDELHDAVVFWIEHLQPTPTAARSRQAHPGRVRARLHQSGRGRSMISPTAVNRSCSSPLSGSTTSAASAAAPNAAGPASRPTWLWHGHRHPPHPAAGRLVPLPLGHPTTIATHPLTYWPTP